jgi:hypothetical protein
VASFYADENFPAQGVEALRGLGHDVLTALDAGQANQRIPDEAVLQFATQAGRAVLTLNRWLAASIWAIWSSPATDSWPMPFSLASSGEIMRGLVASS